MDNRLIVGISGASGAPLAIALLRKLQEHPEIETHLVVTRGGEMALRQETGMEPNVLRKLAEVFHENTNIGAAIASGSFRTMGMIVIPCSMKTVAGIVTGYSDSLLLRAADVCLKERRKLVLVSREAPLSTVHLRNLYAASKLGAVICPPVLTFYHHPKTIEDCIRLTVSRVLSQFHLDGDSYQWEGMDEML